MKKHLAKLIIVITLLVILASASIASASNGDAEYIIPYFGGPEYVVSEGDFIYIRARWGACTYGLTQAFTKQANIILEGPLASVSSRKEAKVYWAKPVPTALGDISDCVPNTDTLYLSLWDYPIGELSPGRYDYHFVYWTDHSFPDGGDYDGDGKPDLFDLYVERDFTIIVE